MFDVLPGSTTEPHAPLADSAGQSCCGEQRSNRPTDARDSAASGHHAIPDWQCTPRRSIAFAAGSAMSAPWRIGDCHATTGIMWSPACRHRSTPAPKIGFSTATPHKTALQIMTPTSGFDDQTRLSLRLVDRVEARICVCLENPGIPGEMPLRMLTAAIRRVEVHRGWWSGAAERLIVANIGPHSPGPRLHLGEHRHCG